MSDKGREQFCQDLDETECNKFIPMNNLEFLEWKSGQQTTGE
jgi:hypothetical protein